MNKNKMQRGIALAMIREAMIVLFRPQLVGPEMIHCLPLPSTLNLNGPSS